ncbi:MAG: DegT/DnrJ/EryC1/StrS family aminotransferase, partial [Deltaproteobacteria bacterium]|nr:DegT/DnrJ/EryC1/StrS family aminotransferase [Deltaproteobacteria bacterium]
VGVNSGTDALVIGLRALAYKVRGRERFEEGDEVITTPFTFTATGESILRAGATPVFVDIGGDYNISPEAIRGAISSKTRGIVVVHLYGNPCRMDEIMDIAREYKLFVLEDVAQAFGSEYNGRKVGSIGDIGAFSFFPSKNLGAYGDGGLITTGDEEIRNFCVYLRNHGGRDKYNVEYCGYNSRLDTIQAAILLKKLRHIDDFIRRRREVAGIYGEELKDCEGIILPEETEKGYHTYHQYTIRVGKGKREVLAEGLKSEGISSMVYYPVLLSNMAVFRGRMRRTDLSNSEKYSQEVISLPIGPSQERETTLKIASAVRKIYQRI